MRKSEPLYRIWAFIKHALTAWNTTGEGIHSPYLFELVRFILRDQNPYYAFAEIERQRKLLLACEDELDVVDFGSQGSSEGIHIQRRVCDIAKGHLESPKVGQMLFRLVTWLSHQAKQPLNIIELGTSFGVTTAYLAIPNSRNNVLTLEGSKALLNVAQGIWKALAIENISWMEGNIDRTLFNYARVPLDLAYIDANHTFEATMRYANYLLPLMAEKGVIVIDDIHYSKEMERAWNSLITNEKVSSSMDLYHVGLLFVDPHYLKRNYKITL